MVVVIFGLWAWGWCPKPSRAFGAMSDREESRMKLLKRKVSNWWVIGVPLLTLVVIVTAIKIQSDATEREWIQNRGIPHPVDATVVEECVYHRGGWFDGRDYYYLRMDSRLKAQDACTQWAALFEKDTTTTISPIAKIRTDNWAWLDILPPSIKRTVRPPKQDGWSIEIEYDMHSVCIFTWDSVDGSTMELIYVSKGP
jgi:hypothetical protein